MKNANDFVGVYKVNDTMTAELIKARLEAEGISSFLKSDNAGGSLSYLTAITGIEIIVCKQDVERANKIIHEWQS